MKDWRAFRAEFPVTRDWIYLNHAAVAPLPRRCVERMQEYLSELSNNGAAHYPKTIVEPLSEVRKRGARILGTRPGQVFVVRSTTQGLGIAATGIAWKQGDNVVLADQEFPANVRPWLPLARLQLRGGDRQGGRVGRARVRPNPQGNAFL